MKVLFVLTYYRPHWTGLTQYAARLAEGLAKRGHEVEVLCSQHEKTLKQKETIEGVSVCRLPFAFKFLRSVIMLGFPVALWQKMKKAETVVVYLPLQEVALVAILAWLLGKRLFLVHNGDLVLPKEGGLGSRLVEKSYALMTGFAIRLSKAILIQTKDYARSSPLLSGFKDKWRVVLPLYDVLPISKKEVEKFLSRNKLKGKVLVGFSGRFVEEKGVDLLLRAIPLVVAKNPKAHFVFAGDYKIKYEKFWDKIKDLIEENKKHITLLGLINDRKKIFAFYRALSVYVQPSKTDCFPSSQIEALLAGAPSVCADIPGARWAVSETGMGEIVKSKNPQALAKGILEVLESKDKYLKKHSRVKEIFDNQKVLDEYEKTFRGN